MDTWLVPESELSSRRSVCDHSPVFNNFSPPRALLRRVTPLTARSTHAHLTDSHFSTARTHTHPHSRSPTLSLTHAYTYTRSYTRLLTHSHVRYLISFFRLFKTLHALSNSSLELS
jgi:hypothetical protein